MTFVRCVRATYGPCPDPDQPGACDDKVRSSSILFFWFWLKSSQPDRVSVLNVATKANGDLDTILGSAYVPDPEHPGELLVQFPGSEYYCLLSGSCIAKAQRCWLHLNFAQTLRAPTGSWRLTTSTTLLSTLARWQLLFLLILLQGFLVDNEFQDFLFGAIKLEFAWILAREQHLDPEMVRMIIMIIKDSGFRIVKQIWGSWWGWQWWWLQWQNDDPQLEHATNVLVENGIDITPLEDTLQNEDCVYERNIWLPWKSFH